MDADHMITTILMNLAKARVEVKCPGVADEPVVVVKRRAEDLHGDMRRGENETKVCSTPALGRKVSMEAKGGTQRKRRGARVFDDEVQPRRKSTQNVKVGSIVYSSETRSEVLKKSTNQQIAQANHLTLIQIAATQLPGQGLEAAPRMQPE